MLIEIISGVFLQYRLGDNDIRSPSHEYVQNIVKIVIQCCCIDTYFKEQIIFEIIAVSAFFQSLVTKKQDIQIYLRFSNEIAKQ